MLVWPPVFITGRKISNMLLDTGANTSAVVQEVLPGEILQIGQIIVKGIGNIHFRTNIVRVPVEIDDVEFELEAVVLPQKILWKKCPF